MDTGEWVLLSDDDGFFDIDEDQIFLGKRNSDQSKSVFDMNHFCTSPKSRKTTEEASRNFLHPKQILHVPIQLEPAEFKKVPDDTKTSLNDVGLPLVPSTEKTKADQDTVSQVSFKIKENEFADMKMDSPRSGGRGLFPPPLDAGGLKFEEKGEGTEVVISPRRKIEKEMVVMEYEKEDEEESNEGFNFWKWSLTGVGAICSFGVAAATICVFFFGSQHRNKLKHDPKIRFQIFTDDKSINQVMQRATKLNEVISAARSVPLSRAHITYGGYYDGL